MLVVGRIMLIKTLKRGTMLDDAPWVWGQEGGWTKDMPKFFQVFAPCTPRTCRTCRVLLGSECMRREGAGDAPNMHVHTALRMYLAVSTLIIGAVIGNAWTRWRHGQRL